MAQGDGRSEIYFHSDFELFSFKNYSINNGHARVECLMDHLASIVDDFLLFIFGFFCLLKLYFEIRRNLFFALISTRLLGGSRVQCVVEKYHTRKLQGV